MTASDEKKNLTVFLVDSINNTWSFYKKRHRGCIENFSEEAVHDIRVSIRRFVSSIDLISSVLPNSYLKELRKILKNQLKIFNPLRDAQVQLLKIKPLVSAYPVLELYLKKLVTDEKYHIEHIKSGIAEFDIKEIEGLVFFIVMTIKQENRNSEFGMHKLYHAANKAYQYTLYLTNIAESDDLEAIHKARVAFKKFRYTMENMQPLIGLSKTEVKEMKQFQTTLGNIQDNNVLMNDLRQFINQHKELSQELFFPIEDEILKDRYALIKNFIENKGIINNFRKSEFFQN